MLCKSASLDIELCFNFNQQQFTYLLERQRHSKIGQYRYNLWLTSWSVSVQRTWRGGVRQKRHGSLIAQSPTLSSPNFVISIHAAFTIHPPLIKRHSSLATTSHCVRLELAKEEEELARKELGKGTIKPMISATALIAEALDLKDIM